MDEEKNSVSFRFPFPPHHRSFLAPSAKSLRNSSRQTSRRATKKILALTRASIPFATEGRRERRPSLRGCSGDQPALMPSLLVRENGCGSLPNGQGRIDELSNSFSITPPTCLYNLLTQPPPVGRPHVAAGAGEGGERYDLVDLAPWDFDFHAWIQEIGRIYDEFQRLAGRENRPHA
jgi:hypothetical protein